MDKERAKFVLRSFRPNGTDAEDQDFADALRLATSDLELGEWLVRERAFDAEFAESLARVDLPADLRANVLLAMVQNASGLPGIDLKEDKRMSDAMAAVEVPVGLRSRILESMEHTIPDRQQTSNWWRLGMPLAAAAGIVFAVLFISDDQRPSQGSQVANVAENSVNGISVEELQDGFVKVYESPIFSLDKIENSKVSLVSHLKERGLPCGDMSFPPGLDSAEGLGCRELILDGKRGSLICFDADGGVAHLIIFMRKDVEGVLPDMQHPTITQSGSWSKASWGNKKYVFALMSACKKADLQNFF